MAFYKSGDPGSKNRWKGNVGRATSRRMERTKCPKCGRKGAIKTEIERGFYGDGRSASVQWCRWKEQGKCDYERIRPIGAAPEASSAVANAYHAGLL